MLKKLMMQGYFTHITLSIIMVNSMWAAICVVASAIRSPLFSTRCYNSKPFSQRAQTFKIKIHKRN